MKLVAIAVTVMLTFASTASAEIIKYELDGQANGDPASLIFFRDTSRGDTNTGPNPSQFGGKNTGYSDPITGRLILNGASYSIEEDDPNANGNFGDFDPGQGDEEIDIVAQLSALNDSRNFYVDILPGAPYASYGDYYINNSSDGVIQGSVIFPTFTQSVVSSAPEPSTWSLLLCGVGFLGLAAKRRRAPALRPA